jgi:hypothetical protein
MSTAADEAIKLFKDISQAKRPPMESRRETIEILSRELRKDHYKDAADALGILDLTPQALGVEADIMRVLLARGFGETTQVFPSVGSYSTYISSSIDNIARLLMSIAAGLFLLVPMIALSYIHSKGIRLAATSLFVVFFAVALSTASKATNQELITATAAYSAVLVVFVGQTSSN